MKAEPLQKRKLKIIQVFEHETLRIGEERDGVVFSEGHYAKLSHIAKTNLRNVIKPAHNGIRFTQFVGVIQVGDLTIEVLPKVDAYSKTDKHSWQHFLLEMLKYCHLIPITSFQNAPLRIGPNSILDLYIEIFINEVEKLLQEGLVKSYQRKEENIPFLKGRMILPKHLRQNHLLKDRFYVDYESFNYDHQLNRILFSAIQVVERLNLKIEAVEKLRKIKMLFPKVSNAVISQRDFDQIRLDRGTYRYKSALEIARILILNFHPDIRGGKEHLLAILFDMNLLFEEFIYRQLKQLQTEALKVKRQVQKPFWKRKYLKPDIIVSTKDQTWVIDTKWKVLKKAQPNIEDLRQIYVYSKYFEASKGVLIYPKVYNSSQPNRAAVPFHPTVGEKEITCQLCFIDIIKHNKLNKKLGEFLLQEVLE